MSSTEIASETPVILPFVSSNEGTRPASTGVLTAEKTIGISLVAAIAACAVFVAIGTITSTLLETRSCIIVVSILASPSAFLKTTFIFLPEAFIVDSIDSRIWLSEGWDMGCTIATVYSFSVFSAPPCAPLSVCELQALMPAIVITAAVAAAKIFVFFIIVFLSSVSACWKHSCS